MILHFLTTVHVLLLVSLQTTGNSLTTIRYTQQKWHSLIPLENNDTLQK